MEKTIIYVDDNGAVVLCWPSTACGLSVEEIAKKDVPAGKPFKIIDSDLLPQEVLFYDALEADMSNPDGFGLGNDAWFALNKKA
jgi:hypothetical protein